MSRRPKKKVMLGGPVSSRAEAQAEVDYYNKFCPRGASVQAVKRSARALPHLRYQVWIKESCLKQKR